MARFIIICKRGTTTLADASWAAKLAPIGIRSRAANDKKAQKEIREKKETE